MINYNRTEAKAKILKMLAPRLKKLGSITTDEAWKLCRNEVHSYDIIRLAFRETMLQMVADGKADVIRNGVYWIYKNN